MFLTAPYIRNPSTDRVHVAWVTSPEASGPHEVAYQTDQAWQRVPARSSSLSRLPAQLHVATIDGMAPGQTGTYRVLSGKIFSPTYRFRSAPMPGTGVRILVTSDAQSMPLTAAAIEAASRLAGSLDFILFPGDLADRPFVPGDWWIPDGLGAGSKESSSGFFPVFQGFAVTSEGVPSGAPLLQETPMYAAIGNHDVEGHEGFRWLPKSVHPNGWNTVTFEELFGPIDRPVGERSYYAFSFGNTRVIVLFVARAWRPGDPNEQTGAIYEEAHPGDPSQWQHGCFPFESIAPGSQQYQWLARELAEPAWQEAAYRIVALHHPIFTQGHDRIPLFTQPKAVETRNSDGQLVARRYTYPVDDLRNGLAPLLSTHGTHLVVNGHSHLYNRFFVDGVHYLETSHLGNTYGVTGDDPSGHTSVRCLSDPAHSYVTVLDTQVPGGLVQTYCTQNGAVVDQFRLKDPADRS